MTYAETQEYLFALRAIGSKFGLERMHALYEAAGRPGQAIPVIHVAGTNGKGSVCAMLEQIARANGYKTGLFTSPHLLRLGERVQVNREILSEEQIVRDVAQLRPLCEQLAEGDPQRHPTFFELMTVIALRHFERECCDVVILETGLGGRLDSTNVVCPSVTAITSIGLDHQEILGDTLEAIAAEKAGIIKRGVPLVLGRLPEPARAVILERARSMAVEVFEADALFDPQTLADAASSRTELPARTSAKCDLRPYPRTALAGEFQRRNAAVALLAYEQLCRSNAQASAHEQLCRSGTQASTLASDSAAPCRRQITNDPQKTLEALRHVQWAGRWQTLRFADGRELILDSSHNEEGARALEENLSRFVRERGVRPVVVTGALGQARACSLLRVICRHAAAVFLVEVSQPRACSIEQMQTAMPADYVGGVFSATVAELFVPVGGVGESLRVYLEATPSAPVMVTGSIYLIGEILTRLQGDISTEAIHLQDKLSAD